MSDSISNLFEAMNIANSEAEGEAYYGGLDDIEPADPEDLLPLEEEVQQVIFMSTRTPLLCKH